MEPIEKVEGTTSEEAAEATRQLFESFTTPRSRRGLLKVAALGAGGLAVGTGTLLSAVPAFAKGATSAKAATSAGDILSIAATAEALAVTFYTHGIKHAHKLGLASDQQEYLEAAVIEEQIHYNFLVANGGKALTKEFSFPHGPNTFTRLGLFVDTLLQLEVDFIAAYLAAVKEFAEQGQPGLAQIAAQIMGVEAEHRVLGRDIGSLVPANNFGYEVALLAKVSDAVGALSSQGYLSPKGENAFTYRAAASSGEGVIHTRP
jgi:hypothetical protein